MQFHHIFHRETKVKMPCAFLTEHHTMKVYWRSGGIASCPSHFTSRERPPGIHWIWCWVGIHNWV